MGAPMCQNLLSAGLQLTVWNRSQAKTEPLAKRGADVAEEMADIAIYLFLMAADAGIDLGQAMQAKLATNEKRYPADRARGRHNKYTDYQPDDE